MEKIEQFLLQAERLAVDSAVAKVYFVVKPGDHVNLKRFEFLKSFYSHFGISSESVDSTNAGEIHLESNTLVFNYQQTLPNTVLYACPPKDSLNSLDEYTACCSRYLQQIQGDKNGLTFDTNSAGENTSLLTESCLLFDLMDKKMLNWNRQVKFLENAENPKEGSHPAIYCQYTMARIEGILRNSPHIQSLYERLGDINRRLDLRRGENKMRSICELLEQESEQKLDQMLSIIERIERCLSLLVKSVENPQHLAQVINEIKAICHKVTKFLSCSRVKAFQPAQTEFLTSVNDVRGLFFCSVLTQLSAIWSVFGLGHAKQM